MKKLFLGLFVVLALGVNAQVESGKLFVGGSFGFGTEKEKATEPTAVDGDKTFSFNLIPEVGFMLTDNIGAGLGIGYDFSKTTQPDFFTGATATYDQVTKTGIFAIMPFARYYQSTGERSFAFAEFALPIGMGSTKNLQMNATNTGTEDADPTKISMFGVQLSVGFNYFLNDKCSIEAKWMGLGFNSMKMTQVNGAFNNGKTVDAVSKTTNFEFGADMTAISIGMKVFI